MDGSFQCQDGCNLFYQVDDFTDPWKPSETVLFVHGFGESGEVWRAWVPYFARNYRVVRIDLRGFGRSTPMPVTFQWSLDVLVSDLSAFIQHLNCGPVHVIAAKSGGGMSFKLAAQHPNLVRTVTGVTPAVRSTSESAPQWLKQIEEEGILAWARDTMHGRLGSGVSEAEFNWWVENLQGKTPISTMLGYLRMVPHMDVRNQLKDIECPVLVIMTGGLGGRRSSESYGEWMKHFKNAELQVIDGNAFHPAGAYPDKCAELTAAFLAKADQA